MTNPPPPSSPGREPGAPAAGPEPPAPPAAASPAVAPVAAASLASEGRSFLRIAVGRFFRNRLAVAALAVVWLLNTIAVFVPLITNDKPLTIVTTFPNRYDNSFFVVLTAADDFHAAMIHYDDAPAAAAAIGAVAPGGDDTKDAKPVKSPAELREERLRNATRQIRQHLGEIRYQLADDRQSRLDELAAQFEAQFDNFDSAAFLKIQSAFEDEFDIEAVTLVPRRYYPLFRVISWMEAAFMALYIFAMIYVAVVAIRWRRHSPQPLRALVIMAVLAAAGGGLWHHYVPAFNDPTDYKRMIREAPETPVVFPPIPYGENENITQDASAAPWWLLDAEARAALTGPHWLGADTNGRDVLCRMVFGARIAMSIGLVAVGIYIAIGIIMGALAGYYRGWVDIVISRLIEIVICFPSFFLIIAVLAFLRPSIINIMVVIGLTGWTGVARLVRGEFLRVVNEEYVTAIRAMGGSDARIIFRHVLPNGMGPVLVSASFGLAAAILAESALSFLGFGVPQPNASWGTLLYDGRNDISGTWWLTVFPGLAIFLTVTALNLVGEGVRDATDPRFFAD